MKQNDTIQLAPPGAGLPAVELFIARLLYPVQLRLGSRESFRALFEKERGAIRELIEKFTLENGGERVLIERPMGLEDSSRYWSLWMTLDHLRILNDVTSGVILSLCKGVVPSRIANTAVVKPSPDVTSSIVADYEASCDRFLEMAVGIENLKTPIRYIHPWFGPLDAYGWYALAGVHLGLHRVQIERILQGLRSTASE